jgi:hypothetical protein
MQDEPEPDEAVPAVRRDIDAVRGATGCTAAGATVRVYSPAKTVADCFKFRHKIGLDVAVEALRKGWRYKRFTLEQLVASASLAGCAASSSLSRNAYVTANQSKRRQNTKVSFDTKPK